MIPPEITLSKVTTEHRAKLAYVYIRQSSLAQVTRHSESTDLQYHLVERAASLGWPPERVEIIDEDLGKSGASAQDRPGFQRLIAEIGLARVGLVVSLDAWPATTGTGTSSWNCARSSVRSSPTASNSTIQACTRIACCWDSPG